MNSKYQAVIGLEIHARLNTETKAFSAEPNAYGADPNEYVSSTVMSHPGALPVVNQAMVEKAIKIGLACQCRIAETLEFSRKHYFYPDLPKGYQITQHKNPICVGGEVEIFNGSVFKSVQLHHIHLEEDAGKSMHDQHAEFSLVDLNRAGTPLVEIVSEPCIHSAEVAQQYFAAIRRLVQYLDICDGNMEEGSLRCDANISIRKIGIQQLGTRVEVKNLNSLKFLKKAIQFEIDRQIVCLESSVQVVQETRTFNQQDGSTSPMRTKEDANDYRYLPEPDLPVYSIELDYVKNLKQELPGLPAKKFREFTEEQGLQPAETFPLIETRQICEYFEQLAQHVKSYKFAANWINGPVRHWLNEKGCGIENFPLEVDRLSQLIELVSKKKVSHSIAAERIFPRLVDEIDVKPLELARKLDLLQSGNSEDMEGMADEILSRFPEKVKAYTNGKKGLIGFFMGEMMKQSRGKIDPTKAQEILKLKLEKA